jgi:predicted  nucleic acid-binding Zn-ribbon protein
VPKADPFVQRRLLDLAGFDQTINAAEHRRATLPQLAVIASGTDKLVELRNAKVLAETEVGDLERATRKDLENLQHEITSLSRRQGVLEDEALELMEQKETADSVLSGIQAEFDRSRAEVAAAESARDDLFADIDAELGHQRKGRIELAADLPAELVGLYERIHKSGRVAAAKLNGGRCDACRMDLDRVELSSIAAAPSDEIVRCPECGAILVRW